MLTLTEPFASASYKSERTRQMILEIISLIQGDPDLRNMLRQAMDGGSPLPKADSTPPPPLLDTSAAGQLLMDETRHEIEAVLPPVVPREKAPLMPYELPIPQPSDTSDSYVDDIVKPNGWDVLTWATAVLNTADWPWSADDIRKVRDWAQTILDKKDSPDVPADVT
jgi:hypothetical protein